MTWTKKAHSFQFLIHQRPIKLNTLLITHKLTKVSREGFREGDSKGRSNDDVCLTNL